jgi:hypothetical protein
MNTTNLISTPWNSVEIIFLFLFIKYICCKKKLKHLSYVDGQFVIQEKKKELGSTINYISIK